MMDSLHKLEQLLRNEPNGWWEQLCDCIPELIALSKTPQPPEYHAEGDVAVHTRLAIEACPNDCDPDLRWAVLLHDIGKPATTKKGPDGRITAFGHAKLSAKMAEEILARLVMPDHRRERIIWVIRHHTFHHSWQLQNPKDLTKKQLRYIRDPNFPLLLETLRIDSLASQGNPNGMRAYEFYKSLWEKQTAENM